MHHDPALQGALMSMSNELTRIVRTAVQALIAFLVNLLLVRFGVDLSAAFDYFGISQEQVTGFVFLIIMPVTTWLVRWLERTVHPTFGILNGPRRSVEYTTRPDMAA